MNLFEYKKLGLMSRKSSSNVLVRDTVREDETRSVASKPAVIMAGCNPPLS